MEIINSLETNLGAFMLVFLRLNGLFVSAPFFGGRNILTRVRVALSFLLTILVVPTLIKSNSFPNIPIDLFYFLLVPIEFLLGVTIGYVANLFFSIVQMAGQILDMQVGFGMVQLMDPTSGQATALMGGFLNVLLIIIFLVTDMHHLLLGAIVESFNSVVVGQAMFDIAMPKVILDVIGSLFATAIKFALPVTIAILLADIAMGMLSKTMPQMNIFVVGIPLKIIIGVFMFSVIIPTYVYALKVGFGELFKSVDAIITLFSH